MKSFFLPFLFIPFIFLAGVCLLNASALAIFTHFYSAPCAPFHEKSFSFSSCLLHPPSSSPKCTYRFLLSCNAYPTGNKNSRIFSNASKLLALLHLGYTRQENVPLKLDTELNPLTDASMEDEEVVNHTIVCVLTHTRRLERGLILCEIKLQLN